MANTYGVMYLRFPRKGKTVYYSGTEEFQIGKGNIVRDGTDATVIACGIEVGYALEAAENLAKENIQVRVVDMFTIKPLDQELVIRCARETGAILTAENHNIYGGLGSAVAEVLAENCPTPMERVGMREYAESGPYEDLIVKYGLEEKTIADQVKKVIQRK